MKRIYYFGLSAVAAALIIGCSSTGGGSVSVLSYLSGNPVLIATQQGAVNTLRTLVAVIYIQKLSSVFKAPSRAESLAPVNSTIPCVDGGNIYRTDDDVAMTYIVKYDQCDQYGTITNGETSATVTLGEGTVTSTTSLKNLTTQNIDRNMTMNMTIYAENNPIANTLNGTVLVSDSTGQATIGYENFRITSDFNSTTYAITNNISGKISQESTTNVCTNGIYDIKTIEGVTQDSNGFTKGTLEVNGATFVFADASTATVTFADGNSTTINPTDPVVCD